MKTDFHLIKRQFWLNRIEEEWKRRSVLWLSGVRRAGKTTLCQTLPDVAYFDCELPRVRQTMDDPQSFLDGLKGRRIVLDEIHRLTNPAELLKIAADHYPSVSIIATGSSTLSASDRFKDTLTGRKSEIWLTPMMSSDAEDFGLRDMKHRLLYGGWPSFARADELPEKDFQEWIDSFWAKDIQDLFRLERRHSFLKFMELVMAQSGGMFEASTFSTPCEVSRTTISNYLRVLETTYVAHVLAPYHTRRSNEIRSAPKVYGFDTGFVCYFKGWRELRPDDLGGLWEHVVLNELQSHFQRREIRYWRDKQGHEVDLVWAERGQAPVAIECKWSGRNPDLGGLRAFRGAYPQGRNILVAQDVDAPFKQQINDLNITFTNLKSLVKTIQSD